MNTIELLERFLTDCFVEHKQEAILRYVTEDIHCYGFSGDQVIHNAEQAGKILCLVNYHTDTDCRVDVWERTELSPECAMLGFTLTYGGISARHRLSGSSRQTPNGRKLFLMHFSAVDPVRAMTILDDLSPKKRVQTGQTPNESTAPGGVGLYRMEENDAATILFTSEGVGTGNGYSDEEYRRLYHDDAMQSIYRDDRATVLEAIHKALDEDTMTSAVFRLNTASGENLWVSGVYSRFGEDNGRPVVRGIFAPVFLHYELQLQALDTDSLGVFVIDVDTEELYYANNACFRLYGAEPSGIVGKTCHEVFLSCKDSCEHCYLRSKEKTNGEPVYVHEKGGRTLLITAKITQWNHHNIAILYVRDDTQRVAMEQDLRQNQEITQAACSFANMWTFTVDLQTKTCYPSAKLQKDFLLPSTLSDFPEAVFAHNLVLPDYRQVCSESLERLSKGEPVVDFDIQAHLPDGITHWLRFRGQLLKSGMADGKPAVFSAQIVDGEKALEARITLERERINRAGENKLFTIITNVSKNTILESYYFNWIKLTQSGNISMDEAMAQSVKLLYFSRDREEYKRVHSRATLLEMYKSGETDMDYVWQMQKNNGDVIWTRNVIRLLPQPGTDDVLLYESLFEITTEKITEELLTTLMAANYEEYGSYNVTNDQYTQLNIVQGYKQPRANIVPFETAVIGFAVPRIHPEDKSLFLEKCQALKTLNTSPQPYSTFRYRTVEGESVRYKQNMAYVYDRERNIIFLARTDITELVLNEEREKQRLSEALKAAEQATQAKSDFLSRMSHEIRTPMNAIMGMTAIAQENCADVDQVSECLNNIDVSSHYLLTLINDILEMSRIESGRTDIKKEPFDFNAMIGAIGTIMEPLALKNDVRYEVVNEVTVSSQYLGDVMRIQQVIVNIITNALKFTKRGGCVRFCITGEQSGDRITKFKFIVADTGIGMSREFMLRMYEPFAQEDGGTTSEYTGSGLGLAISKRLTIAMGGTIQAESVLGKGTTFTIEIPLERALQTSAASLSETVGEGENKSSYRERLGGCRVLMAEDQPMNVKVARRILERCGIVVTVAENGKMAVDVFHNSAVGYFDAILMDIRMPLMDGLDAARAIRAADRSDAKTIPIIAMTANALDGDRRNSKDAGMNAHLAKPFEPEELYEVLADQIENREKRL